MLWPKIYSIWVSRLKLDFFQRRRLGSRIAGNASSSSLRPETQSGEWPEKLYSTYPTPQDIKDSIPRWKTRNHWPTPSTPNGGRWICMEAVLDLGYRGPGEVHHQVYIGTLAKFHWLFRRVQREELSPLLPPGQETSRSGVESLAKSLVLNPLFAAWMMNWPLGWGLPARMSMIAFDSWETESYRLLQRMLSASWPFDWPTDEPMINWS
jgi:hypothetical protein